MSLQDIYRHPLKDLGEVLGEDYRGIFSPLYEDAVLARYLNTQFTTSCQWYVEHCERSERNAYTGRVLQRCFAEIGRKPVLPAAGRILDIGSGAGNSIVSLLTMFPQQFIVASDLSPQMLLALRKSLLPRFSCDNLHLLQLNAEHPDFRPGSFDLVVGIAILHHLIDPSLAIRGVAGILQPGGLAIFSEPFENGNYLLCLACRMILRDAAARELSARMRQLLSDRITAIAARSGLEKTPEFLHSQDDKWLFTPRLVEKVARDSGFSRCHIMPIAQKADPLTRKMRALILYREWPPEELPVWAWAIIAEVESGMSSLLRQEMPVEAAIILEK